MSIVDSRTPVRALQLHRSASKIAARNLPYLLHPRMPSNTVAPAFSLQLRATPPLPSSFCPKALICSCRFRARSQFASHPAFDLSHIAPHRAAVWSNQSLTTCTNSRDVSIPLTAHTPTDSKSSQDAVCPASKFHKRPRRPAHGRRHVSSTHALPSTILNTPSSSSETTRLKGRACLASGDFRRARNLFQRSVDIDPTNGRAWQDLAKLKERMSRSLNEKVNVLETALKHNPNNPYLWQSLAFVKLRMSKLDEALQHCQQGLARDPLHVPLYVTWAAAEEKLHNFAKAREIYENAELLSKPGAKMYHSWGHMELRQGNERRALHLFEKGLNHEPLNHYIWQSLGSIARTNHDIPRARDCFRNALRCDELNVVVLEEWAKLEVQAKNYDVARALFARGAAANRKDTRILHSWSLLEYQMKSFQKAKELVEDAVRISTQDSILWNHYAKVEAARHNYPRARALYKRACEVNPRDWLSWDNWSALEHKLGNTEQAAKLLQESFRIRFNAKGAFTILANNINDAPPTDVHNQDVC